MAKHVWANAAVVSYWLSHIGFPTLAFFAVYRVAYWVA